MHRSPSMSIELIISRLGRIWKSQPSKVNHLLIATYSKTLIDEFGTLTNSANAIHDNISVAEHLPLLGTTEIASVPETNTIPLFKKCAQSKRTSFIYTETFQSYATQKGYSRSFVVQRVCNSKSIEELIEFLGAMFRRAMVIDSETGICKELLLDKDLLLLILSQCQRMRDLRLPWILLSQIRLLGDKHAQRLIDMDIYNTILNLLVHVPRKLRDLHYSPDTPHITDTSPNQKISYLTENRWTVCAPWIQYTLYEVSRYQLQWNIDTYHILLQYYWMENQFLKANQLIAKLGKYIYYLKKKKDNQQQSLTTAEVSLSNPIPELERIHMKYKKLIEETQTKHRKELFESSSLIFREKEPQIRQNETPISDMLPTNTESP
jgi:hypothetical protein